jgi:hypothetical protein
MANCHHEIEEEDCSRWQGAEKGLRRSIIEYHAVAVNPGSVGVKLPPGLASVKNLCPHRTWNGVTHREVFPRLYHGTDGKRLLPVDLRRTSPWKNTN